MTLVFYICLSILIILLVNCCIYQYRLIRTQQQDLASYIRGIGNLQDLNTKEETLRKEIKAQIGQLETVTESVNQLIQQKREREEELDSLSEQQNIVQQYKEEIANLLEKIECYRNKLQIVTQQEENKEDKEFNELHSIYLSEADLSDIQIIKDCAFKLKRPNSLFKAIWTEYYQKPFQDLRKILNADKITGIYKITNKNNQKCYIGQSLDIGDRWQQHAKSGIGVGTINYLTNKFYKALHQEGLQNFTFEILESCPKQELDEKERYWIKFFNTKEFGYNSVERR